MKDNQKINNLKFIPTTKEELTILEWGKLDVILISGDTYIDSPYDGIAVVGRTLLDAGYKVGIIAQPDISSDIDITRLGEPLLFWGISAGCVDSMVANYSALKRPKKFDDLTPGNNNNRRPDRATIVYTNLIKKYFKNTKPIILGGVEASLRRIAHYDYWSDSIRRSILFDAKADIIIYGEGEKTILELAEKINRNEEYYSQRGICFISDIPSTNYIELPSYEEVSKDKQKFTEMFSDFYKNNDPLNAKGLYQKYQNKYLIQNPPNFYLDGKDLDRIYEFDYQYQPHPFYQQQGEIKAMDTIKFSIVSHRGCFGECNFCSIAVHQGRRVRNRTEESIINEVKKITNLNNFKGYIYDIGGATANMFGMECKIQKEKGSCKEKRCLFPKPCKKMNIDHSRQTTLLKKIRNIGKIKKCFVSSGLRYELIDWDKKSGNEYLKELIKYHVSGQLKIAPEHIENEILELMGKPDVNCLFEFVNNFYRINKEMNLKQFLTYYLIAAHPGSTAEKMQNLKNYFTENFSVLPEQIQIFTPTPSTYSTLMYWTAVNPFTGNKIIVEKDLKQKENQKKALSKFKKR